MDSASLPMDEVVIPVAWIFIAAARAMYSMVYADSA